MSDGMAPLYYRISPAIWMNRAWTDDDRLVGLYLLTSPHRTLEGLFWLPKQYVCGDLQWLPERLMKPFDHLISDGFLGYDEAAEVALVCKALKYQSPANPNMVTAAIRRVQAVPVTGLDSLFLTAADEFCKPLAERLRKRLPKRFGKPQLYSTHLSSLSTLSDSGESNDIESTPSDTSPDDFDLFYGPYPRKESKQAARRSWKRVPKKDRAAAVTAAEAMAECVTRGWQEKTFCPHPSTFLNQRRWEDWADGPPANYLPDQSTTGNLTDVLDAGAQAFGLIGDEHDQLGTAEDDGTEGTLTGSQDARRRLPACELAAGQ